MDPRTIIQNNIQNNYLIASSPGNVFTTPSHHINQLSTLPVQFYGSFQDDLKDIVTNSVTSTPVGIVPSLHNLIHQLGLTDRLPSKKEGTSNTVYRYTSKDTAIRVSKKPAPINVQLGADGICKIFVTRQDQHTSKELETIKATKDNWEKAAMYNICPEIFFNGYIIKQQNGRQYLHSVTVSRCYQCDLDEYFTKKKNNGWEYIKDTTIYPHPKTAIIATKLIECFTKMARLMHVICFDIKPLNAVINDYGPNEEDIDVKLIDMDVDWCNDYSNVLQRNRTADNQTEKIIIIINLYMANLFYHHVGCNIFYSVFTDPNYGGYLFKNYMLETKDNRTRLMINDRNGQFSGIIPSLIELWCELKDPDGEYNRFHELAKHYLVDLYNCGSTSIGQDMHCNETFKYILKNSVKIYNKPLIDFWSRENSAGGYKSKNKSRRVRKMKKKTKRKRNRKTKRK